METTNITPVLNLETLQQKANEYAQKGAEKELEEFYTGYKSPFRKSIEEHLKNKVTSHMFDIPDIVGILNDKIIAEFDQIAHTAIANSLIPFAKELLTRQEETVRFSDILKQFIKSEYNEYDSDADKDYYECSVEKDDTYSWLNVVISNENIEFKMTLHEVKKGDNKNTYELLGLPYGISSRNDRYRNIIIKKEDHSIEIPITTELLTNKFTAYLCSLIIARCEIIIDKREFDYDMFPQKDCHC